MAAFDPAQAAPISRMNAAPRKVTIATVMATFDGDVSRRLEAIAHQVDEAVRQAEGNTSKRLDLIVFPETAIQSGRTGNAADKAVGLDEVSEALGRMASTHGVYLIVPMMLREGEKQISNAAVLFDRQGRVAGIYRKIHPVIYPDESLELGVTPGGDAPVFECDFGKVGIQICWDIMYDDGWEELASKGAEVVAFPSASPATLRLMAHALRGRYYVVNSTPRDNLTILNPIGMTVAQKTSTGILVQTVDLSYAVLHWSPTLSNGKLFKNRYGEKAGFDYSAREDTGMFWSNDPDKTVGQMVKELGLRELDTEVQKSLEIRRKIIP